MKFSTFTKAVAGSVALSAMMAGAALAEPALIYDLGGKFDKSFNEAAYNGAEAWKAATGGTYVDLDLIADPDDSRDLFGMLMRAAPGSAAAA